MKKKKNKLVWVILILLVIFGIMIYFYINPLSTTDASSGLESTTSEAQVSVQTITKSITSSRCYIISNNREITLEHK
ncbi:MAG: hypothetical protein LBL91_00665 [Lachnospiraceae bacterium]|jgi:flagellar basal body-associated protein FliL|nr:hypothetical protein [Lachnospiraceae bacterium]